MRPFKHPAFAKLAAKIDRATNELAEISQYLSKHGHEMSSGEWGATSAVSLGIHNVYNGIEDILLSLANDVDGFVPGGSTIHQDLLDQMSAPIESVRPALLDLPLYRSLSELKSFRHLVRHRYGFDLSSGKVQENLERVREALPLFVKSVVALEQALTEEDLKDDPGDGT